MQKQPLNKQSSQSPINKQQRCHKKKLFVVEDNQIHILKNGAFEERNVGAAENADIMTHVHLPDRLNPDGMWHYCPVISGDSLSRLYEGQYILCDAWYAIFPMEDKCYYIPIEIVHPVHLL